MYRFRGWEFQNRLPLHNSRHRWSLQVNNIHTITTYIHQPTFILWFIEPMWPVAKLSGIRLEAGESDHDIFIVKHSLKTSCRDRAEVLYFLLPPNHIIIMVCSFNCPTSIFYWLEPSTSIPPHICVYSHPSPDTCRQQEGVTPVVVTTHSTQTTRLVVEIELSKETGTSSLLRKRYSLTEREVPYFASACPYYGSSVKCTEQISSRVA